MKLKNKLLASILSVLIVLGGFSLTACSTCVHSWSDWSVTKNATCITTGAKERMCNNCGKIATAKIDALGHDWQEATCETAKTCKRCLVTEGTTLPHVYDCEEAIEAALKTEATCENKAVYYKSCACGLISNNDAEVFSYGNKKEHVDDNKDHKCDDCESQIGNHLDSNKDHICDYGCGDVIGTCEDANKDHACDYGCGEFFGVCQDENKDHACDYGCEEYFGAHEDGDDADHLCDYGCGVIADDGCYDLVVNGKCDECNADMDHNCVDSDKDHACDICVAYMGEHTDSNLDHVCDYGCEESIGVCQDENKDHACDYGCEEYFGAHEDGDDADHLCDYGCGVIADDGCYDLVVNGKCDECNADMDHNCVDSDKDHACDICVAYMGEHTDSNLDHVCDYGCEESIGACQDENKDHDCDYGCNKAHGVCQDENKDHACDYGCDKIFGACEDINFDHVCDYGCDKEFGVCQDENKDHACDYGCDEVFGEHLDSNSDGDHVCDYGCLETLEDCYDSLDDGDHHCDICGNNDISSCEYSQATCSNPATCYECGRTVGTTIDHIDLDFNHVCDNGCGKSDMGSHEDSNSDGDHVCDYGCNVVLENCYDVETDLDHDCDVCGKANVTTHVYVENVSLATQATCHDPATKTFECNCGHFYTDEDGAALGHNIKGVTAEERQVDGCEYVLVYVCQRDGCGQEVFGETVYKHKYVASISTPATCQSNGLKTFKCSECGDESKEPEVIPADKTGHNWNVGEVVDGIRTDTCSICSATKTTIVSESNSASSNASDLAETGVQLKIDGENSANIQLGQGVADAIGNKDITISADVVNEDALKDLGVSNEQLSQIGKNTVYDFNIHSEGCLFSRYKLLLCKGIAKRFFIRVYGKCYRLFLCNHFHLNSFLSFAKRCILRIGCRFPKVFFGCLCT